MELGVSVRVFISSVRRGLEEERDALPGLISALGHQPVRFEDFTAQPVPSRQACMDAVSGSDMCLLLLGPAYGDRMPDTAVSPTHEEFNVARAHSVPVYAFVKRGADMDADQRSFVDQVEQYTTGRFRASFDGAADLLTAVAGNIRQHESAPQALVWEDLQTTAPEVAWVAPTDGQARHPGMLAIVELHVLPAPPASRLPVKQLGSMASVLATSGREHGLFTQSEAVTIGADDHAAWAESDDQRGGSTGIRVRRDGTVTVWSPLPSNGLGTVVDEEDLARQVAAKVRLAAALGVVSGQRAAIAAGLSGLMMASEARVADIGRRSSTSLSFGRQQVVRVEPEDSVPVEALGHGAGDIGHEIAARLVQGFRRTRR